MFGVSTADNRQNAFRQPVNMVSVLPARANFLALYGLQQGFRSHEIDLSPPLPGLSFSQRPQPVFSTPVPPNLSRVGNGSKKAQREKQSKKQHTVKRKAAMGKTKTKKTSSKPHVKEKRPEKPQNTAVTVNVNRLNGRIFEDQIEIELRKSHKITSFERHVPCYPKNNRGFADFVLKPKSGPRIVIEAKNFDRAPIQAKNVKQVYKYGKYLHAKPKIVVSNSTIMPPSKEVKDLAREKGVVIQTFAQFKKYLQG